MLIGDGCAIGAYIQDLVLTGASLYLPESFEWMLLQNNMFQHVKEVLDFTENQEKKVDTSYVSAERYCTELLSNIIRQGKKGFEQEDRCG